MKNILIAAILFTGILLAPLGVYGAKLDFTGTKRNDAAFKKVICLEDGTTYLIGSSSPKNSTEIWGTIMRISPDGKLNVKRYEGYLEDATFSKDEKTIYILTGNRVQQLSIDGTVLATIELDANIHLSAIAADESGVWGCGRVEANEADAPRYNRYHGDKDGTIVHIGVDGKVELNCYGGSKEDSLDSIAIDSESIWACGYSSSNDGDLAGKNHGKNDGWILKVNKSDLSETNTLYGTDGEDFLNSIALSGDAIWCCGYSSNQNSGKNGWILKLKNRDPKKAESKIYGGSGRDWLSSICINGDSIWACGCSNSNDGDLAGKNHGNDDGWIIKLDRSGKLLSSKLYGGSNRDWLNQITFTDTIIYCAGGSNSTDGDLKDTVTDKKSGWLLRIRHRSDR